MSSRNFFGELKRRNVYKVAVAYAVVGWLLVQVATQVFPFFEIPNWAVRLVVLLIVIGYPIALVIAWAFELTPEGIKRTADVDLTAAARHPRKHAWIFVALVAAALSLGLFFIGRYTGRNAARIGSASELPAKSIAVLPFDNLSHDPDNAYFAEGVQDEILTRLAKVADLKVISRTSTQRFKSAPDNLPQIAKQLGVMHILEGSVQKANDQVRVNVQLINALTDAHLWADTYDRKLIDIFSVESEIAKTIAETLQAKLTGSEKTLLAKKPTANPEAYQLYLQGRFFWNKRTAADLRKSIDYFNEAIAKDPNYALAYAGLAQSWMLLSAYNGGAPKETYPQAEAAARKALALDETSSDAIVALASFKTVYEFDYAGSLKEYERAIRLNPNDATAHHWLATDVFATTGQHERELAEMKRALELDPLSLVIHTNLGTAYLHSARLDEALTELRKTVDMDGSFYFARWSYGMALEVQGKIPEAIAQYEKAAAITDDPVVQGVRGRIYGMTGRRDEARKILDRLHQSRSQRYTSAYALALVCVGLADHTEAVNWLEEDYRDRDGNSVGYIRIDPLLAPLHGDPRFEALAEKIVPASQFHAVAK
ncbi:MAG: tetratricopeptide repeat protein [Chthoniobacterales bacterium]